MPEPPGLPQRLLGREGRALHPEQLGRFLLACHVGAVESEHPGVVRVQGGQHLERVPVALPDHAVQQLERGAAVASVDGVGEIPRRHAAVVAEEGLDLGAVILGPAP